MFQRLAFSFVLSCCLAAQSTAHAALRVVTSTMDLASIAKAVGGEHVEVESVCAPGQDPHYIQARPSFMRSVADADLFIRIGLELEKTWEAPLLRGARNDKVQLGAVGHLDASERIAKLGVPTQTTDRSMGDIHGHGNPHYWLDPYNGRLIAGAVAERLAKLDPGHAAAFAQSRAAFERRLDERMFGAKLVQRFTGQVLWREDKSKNLLAFLQTQGAIGDLGGWRAEAQRIARMPVVTFHSSWAYLSERFGFPVVETLEPKPGIPPSPGHLLNVIKAVQERKVGLIVLEPFYERKAADFVASKTGVPVAVLSNNAASEAPDAYLELFDRVVGALAEAAARRP